VRSGATDVTSSQPPLSPQHAYFQRIEREFIGLRGAPMLLTPKDWQVIARWYEAGVPLGLVVQTIAELFEKRKESGKSSRISSISYCAGAVERAWLAAQEMLLYPSTASRPPSSDQPGGPTQTEALESEAWQASAEQRLALLTQSLPESLPRVAEWRERVLECGQAEDLAAAEEQLIAVERELLEKSLAVLSTAERERIELEVARATSRLRSLIPAGELRLAEGSVRRQVLREQLALPRLSLFPAVY
jgi:hypothetical protein